MAQRKGDIRLAANANGSWLTFKWGMGAGEEWQEMLSRTYNLDEVEENVKHQIAMYGLRKLLMDRTSDTKKDMQATGDPSFQSEAMDAVFKLFVDGYFTQPKKAKKAPSIPVEVEALAEYKGLTIGTAQKAWDKLSKEAQDNMRANASFSAEMERVEEARLQAEDVDLSDLIGEDI